MLVNSSLLLLYFSRCWWARLHRLAHQPTSYPVCVWYSSSEFLIPSTTRRTTAKCSPSTRDRAGCWAGGEKLIEEVAHYCSMVCLSQRWPADMCRAAGLFWYYLIIHTEKYLHKSIQMDYFASLNVKISTRACTVTARQSLLRFDAKQEARVSLIITCLCLWRWNLSWRFFNKTSVEFTESSRNPRLFRKITSHNY